MSNLKFFQRSFKEIMVAIGPVLLLFIAGIILVYKFVDPAPPKHMVIATGEESGNYQTFAAEYKKIIKGDGIDLEIRPSKGAGDNLRSLGDPKSGVDVGFVQDGLGTRQKNPGLSSLGSIYYEPIWILYRGKGEITRLNQFIGKKIAMGEKGGEAHAMAKKLLTASGVDEKNAELLELPADQSAEALKTGKVDAAFFIASANNPLVSGLLRDPNLQVVSLDQAEAVTRQFPYLHHLVLPHGTLDLQKNIPARDIDLVGATATLVVRDTLHPALVYLLLKAASKVHHEAGLFEKKKEFPTDKDYSFPLNEGAKSFYKSGAPFWLRYLPFWLATLVERFIFLVVPLMALVLPIVRLVPRYLQWRVKGQIYQRYGELKFLENQISQNASAEVYHEHLAHLDKIEDRVNAMKIPLDFSDYVYHLREHVDFVRERIHRLLKSPLDRDEGRRVGSHR
jgi:uncharacterized protein